MGSTRPTHENMRDTSNIYRVLYCGSMSAVSSSLSFLFQTVENVGAESGRTTRGHICMCAGVLLHCFVLFVVRVQPPLLRHFTIT